MENSKINSAVVTDKLRLLLRGIHGLDLKSLTTIFAFISVSVVIYRALFHPLARVPGPRLAAVTGLWRTYHYALGAWHDDVLALHNTYGRVVRIAPNEVSVVDATAMKQLYGHGRSAKKTTWYSTWQVKDTPTAFFAEQEPKVHAALRRRVSAAYSMSAILRFEKYIQNCLDLCFFKLKSHAEADNVVEMSDWTNALAFDVVGEIAFGQQLGHLRTESDVNGLRAGIHGGFKVASILGHIPGQVGLLTNSFTAAILRMIGIVNSMTEFAIWSKTRVSARRNGEDGSEREDMLSHFMQMKSLDGAQPATDGEVLIEAMNIIGAGADTTSVGMRSCLYFLGTHPEVYHKLQQGIDKYYEERGLLEPINYNQTQEIQYLRAVVTESLRLFPSIVYQLLRYSPEGGITINGHYIPAGYTVGISPLAQNRDKAVFGKDANEFKPERWLESTARTSSMESGNMTFGGNGPRTCIGRNISLVEINKFIGQLLRNFDIEFVNKEQPWKIITYWFAHQYDMKMRIKLRPGNTIRKVQI